LVGNFFKFKLYLKHLFGVALYLRYFLLLSAGQTIFKHFLSFSFLQVMVLISRLL